MRTRAVMTAEQTEVCSLILFRSHCSLKNQFALVYQEFFIVCLFFFFILLDKTLFTMMAWQSMLVLPVHSHRLPHPHEVLAVLLFKWRMSVGDNGVILSIYYVLDTSFRYIITS